MISSRRVGRETQTVRGSKALPYLFLIIMFFQVSVSHYALYLLTGTPLETICKPMPVITPHLASRGELGEFEADQGYLANSELHKVNPRTPLARIYMNKTRSLHTWTTALINHEMTAIDTFSPFLDIPSIPSSSIYNLFLDWSPTGKRKYEVSFVKRPASAVYPAIAAVNYLVSHLWKRSRKGDLRYR